MACTLIDRDGLDADEAAGVASRRWNIPIEAVRIRIAWTLRRFKTLRRLELERKVMVGWRAGLTDAENARRIGRHPKTVARIRRGVISELESGA